MWLCKSLVCVDCMSEPSCAPHSDWRCAACFALTGIPADKSCICAAELHSRRRGHAEANSGVQGGRILCKKTSVQISVGKPFQTQSLDWGTGDMAATSMSSIQSVVVTVLCLYRADQPPTQPNVITCIIMSSPLLPYTRSVLMITVPFVL